MANPFRNRPVARPSTYARPVHGSVPIHHGVRESFYPKVVNRKFTPGSKEHLECARIQQGILEIFYRGFAPVYREFKSLNRFTHSWKLYHLRSMIKRVPLERSSCIIMRQMRAPCDRCGRSSSPVHMPRNQVGIYCEVCCPRCSQSEPPNQETLQSKRTLK